jgi:hypothetical protein
MHHQEVALVEQDIFSVFGLGQVELGSCSRYNRQQAGKNSREEALHAANHVPEHGGLEVFF